MRVIVIPNEIEKIQNAYHSAAEYICGGDAKSARYIIDETYDAIANTPSLKDFAAKLVQHINWWNEETFEEHIAEAETLVEEISGTLGEWLANNE